MNLFNTIKEEEKVDFANNFSVMLKSGMTVNEALNTLADQTDTKKFREVLLHIRDQVSAGVPLSKSFEAEQEIFGSVFISLIKVGESSGSLDESLTYLAQWIERDYALKQEINAATVYPKFVLSATFAMGGGLALYILPKLVPLFGQLRVELPFATRLLLWGTSFLQHYWYLVILGFIGIYFAFKALMKIYQFKKFFHLISMKIPFIGGLIMAYQLALVTRLFETLLKSGVTVRETLSITSDAVSNIHYRESLVAMNERIIGGTPLSQSMADYPALYPKNIISIVSTGEKSGTIDTALGYLADHYIKSVQAKTKKLPVILEPALLIFIGLVVGFLALAIIMPIYGLTSGKF